MLNDVDRKKSTNSRNVVHIRLLHHSAHRVLDRPIVEFEIRVFIPDGLQIEIRTVHVFLQKCQVSGVGDSFSSIVEFG